MGQRGFHASVISRSAGAPHKAAMDITRRELVAGCAAGAVFPAAACAAVAAGGQFTPEAFGAAGDGATDDYDAFQRMAAAVNGAGGGTVSFTPGRTYFLGRYAAPGNGVSDVVFRRCSGLAIEGNGATLSVKGDYFRETRATRGLAGLSFEDCSGLSVRNVQLVGNVQLTRRAAGVAEAATHGLIFGGCSDVTVDGVIARHFAADGLYIRASGTPDGAGRYRACRRFTVRNSRFLHNARQGLSVIQLRDGIFDDCEFSYTGYVDPQSNMGPYGNHAPSAGIDVEPNATPYSPRPVDVLTGNIAFHNCRMAGNLGAALTAGQVSGGQSTMENVIVDGCTIIASAVSPLRYGMIFDVPGGKVTGSTFELGDKTVFIGWYPESSASPEFTGNTVSGTGTGPSHALLIVRRTRGAPVVGGNRFIVTGPARTQPIEVDNPNAIVRDNQVGSSAV